MFVHDFMVLTWRSGVDHTQLMRTWWVAIFYYLWCGDSGERLKLVDDLSLPRRNVSLNGMGQCALSHETLKGWWDPRLHFVVPSVVYVKKHLPQWPDCTPRVRCLPQPECDILPLYRAPFGISWSFRQRRRQQMGPSVISVSIYNCAFVCLLSSRNYLYLCKCCC